MKEEVDFNIFKAQILEDIKAGKPLFGKDGALAPMIENIVNAALEGEMDAHLTQESRESGNRRNGKMQKQVQTPVGDITVTTPRDRDASFEPQLIKKRETMLSEGMADRIIGLYALGTSTRDISNWLEETVGTSVSAETISSICKKQVFDQQFSEKLISADFGKLVLHVVIDKAVMRQRAAASLLGA